MTAPSGGQVVVNTAECQWAGLASYTPCVNTTRCLGCLGDGRRALLGTAIPVWAVDKITDEDPQCWAEEVDR
jgi:hypothetical protein